MMQNACVTSEDAAATAPYHAIGYAGDVVIMDAVDLGIAAIRVVGMRTCGPMNRVRFLGADHGGRIDSPNVVSFL